MSDMFQRKCWLTLWKVLSDRYVTGQWLTVIDGPFGGARDNDSRDNDSPVKYVQSQLSYDAPRGGGGGGVSNSSDSSSSTWPDNEEPNEFEEHLASEFNDCELKRRKERESGWMRKEEEGGRRKEGWGRAEGRMWMLGLWICWSRFECWIFEFVWWDLNVRALNLLEDILMFEQWIC